MKIRIIDFVTYSLVSFFFFHKKFFKKKKVFKLTAIIKPNVMPISISGTMNSNAVNIGERICWSKFFHISNFN